jgi:twitching motility protein PilI
MSSIDMPAFAALSDLAEKSLKFSVGLPAQDEAVELWNGIGFPMAGYQCVAGMGSVAELLHLPKYTIVPGVKSWILGVSNVRGRLLPIIDLARYFGLSASQSRFRDKRVLVVEQEELLNGFIVDDVQGMQYFPADSFNTNVSQHLPPTLTPFVNGTYTKNDTEWLVFDSKFLINNEKFLDVSLA